VVRRALLLAVLLGSVLTAPPVAASPAVTVTRDVQYGAANGKPLLLDAYVPPSDGGERRPAVILIHGGGFRSGDKASFAPEAQKLVLRGWVAFSVNYRLDEQYAFPAELDDVRAAVHWVRDHAAEYEVDPGAIGVLGESAGGTLAALLATTQSPTEPGIAAAVSWSGPMDLVALAEQRDDLWGVPLMGCSVSVCRDRFAQASPINHVNTGGAPLQLHTSAEELVPVEQARLMADRLERAGVGVALRVMRGNRHALDYRDEAIGPTIEFLRQLLEKPPPSSTSTAAFLVTLAVVVIGGAWLIARRTRRLRAPAGT